MTALVDSHCHLHNAEYFPGDPADYLARAQEAGVEQIVVIGTSHADALAAQAFAAQHDGVFWTYGIHPENHAAPGGDIELDDKLIAIGEVGLDYHYDGDRQQQWHLLERMLDLGLRHDLPFSFHVREAFPDFFSILGNFPTVRGVVHSFTDSKQNLRRALDYGFYIGVNGLATYSTLPKPPLERTLLETDAPFLAPVPHRGERCEPAFVRDIAAWLAKEHGVSPEEVATATTRNFADLFLTH